MRKGKGRRGQRAQAAASARARSEKQAIALLRETGWEVEAAAEAWFSRGMVPEGAVEVKVANVEAEFARLAGSSGASKLPLEGFVSMCEELEVDPETDATVLLLLYMMRATSMDNVPREAFVRGFQVMGANKVSDLKGKLSTLRKEAKGNDATLAGIWTTAYRVNTPEGMRVISRDVAAALVNLLVASSPADAKGDFLGVVWPLKDAFLAFLDHAKPPTVTRDTWQQLRRLITSVKHDLSDFVSDDASAWPVLLDDFVSWARTSRIAGIALPDAAGAAAAGGGGSAPRK